ncbi:uncharacterized protein N7498_003352 [Penicillium cinerascens]|uniref:Uncharacterized protein n=1 Tax=Penicillium cinerascens TaxID=70096 RepID=A0A9W9N1Z0_9EURO|nr:uncharacterized protein N7498_003352 [Penicillium cinerascens]KAJ5211706.1 hypothetical protein N7498_003352 [Penicillium cinerascens]
MSSNFADSNLPRFQGQATETPATVSENMLDLISSSGREIDVFREGVSGNLQLLSSRNKTPLYFVCCSIFHPNRPDVTLYTGNDRKGKVIGVCSNTRFSDSITVGRGNPAHPNSMEWEEVVKVSRDHSSYKFSIWSRAAERRSYSWKRTQDSNMKGIKSSKLDRRSWKLEDDMSGEVVAVFAANGIQKSFKKVGKLRFLVGEEKVSGEWILLTWISLYENARRRALARRDLTWFF